MRKLILVLMCAVLLPTSAARAQLFAPNAAGVSMGHLHYFVRDMAANRKFWTDLGATPVMLGTREVLRFPGLTVLLSQGELFEFDVETCLLTRTTGHGDPAPAHTVWRSK